METKYVSTLFSTPIWLVSELIGLPSQKYVKAKLRTILHKIYRFMTVFFYASSLAFAINHDAALTYGRIPFICNYLKLYIGVIIIVCSHTQLLGNHFKNVTLSKIGDHFMSIDKHFYSVFKYSGDVIFLYYYAYVYPYLIAEMLLLQFVSLVKALHIRFTVINELLKSTMDYSENTMDHKEQSAIFISDIVKKRIIDSPNSIKCSYERSNSNCECFQVLFELHDRLLNVAEKVNLSYSISTVAFITGSFVLVLFAMLYEVKIVFDNSKKDFYLLVIASSYLLWSIQCILAILLLLFVCESTRQEAYETPIYVHQILQMKPKFIQQDDIYYNKMKSFMIQMLHRKKVFNFTGSGLFNLDYTFIFSVVSAATSYLIVLLQFDVKFDTTDTLN